MTIRVRMLFRLVGCPCPLVSLPSPTEMQRSLLILMSSALPALVLALVPGLVGPLKTSQSHRAHRLSAHPIASITASPLEATAVELRPETAVQLLTTPPELMPAALRARNE